MTLLLAFATTDFVYFSGDNRITQVDDEKVYHDDIRKVYRINNHAMFAFSGDYNVTVSLTNFIKSQSFLNSNVQAIARKISRYLRNILNENKMIQQGVFIGGVGDGNKITMINMGHEDNFKLKKIVPEQDHIKWEIRSSIISPYEYIDESVKTSVANGEIIDLDKIEKIVAGVYKFVSDNDAYVSPTYNKDYILLRS